MQALDRFLQGWRARVTARWIRPGTRLLDIGCHQGELLGQLGERLGPSAGIDPLLREGRSGRVTLLPISFAEPLPFPDGAFDAITMLAVLEHMPEKDALARECYRLLVPGGRLIITVPSRAVDPIIEGLVKLGLADGMSLEQHHGYDPAETTRVFGPPRFEVEARQRFQFGLNNLFVLRRGPTI